MFVQDRDQWQSEPKQSNLSSKEVSYQVSTKRDNEEDGHEWEPDVPGAAQAR